MHLDRFRRLQLDFTEDLLLKLPDLRGQGGVAGVSENHAYDKNMKESLVVEIAAIHEGLTSNFNLYTRETLAESVESWYTPYPKPLIKNHDQYEEPLGRVMHAEMQTEQDGLSYIKLQVAVTDPAAVEKVLDGRYLTGSVGGKADEALCSICGEDWANKNLFEGLPCKHERGKAYKGSVASLEMRGISWKEYSMVNVPADNLSGIRGAITAGECHDVGLFALNMQEQEIYGLTDRGVTNLLEGLKKKEARPLYMQTKGAFLSALAQSKLSIDTDEEAELDIDTQEEEDILSVVEGLSDDLATAAEESNSAEDNDSDETAEVVNEDQKTEEEETTPEENNDDVVDAAEEEVEEEVEDSAPEAEEDEDTTTSLEDEDSVVAEEEAVAEEEEAETVVEEDSDDEDREERLAALEAQVEELTEDKQKLLDENGKLKAALKKGLAERVVDSKIALGYEDSENRATLVEEHMKRSAGSLADFLSDFASMTDKSIITTDESLPEVDTKAVSIDEDADVDGDGSKVKESDIPQDEIDPERFFQDVFMGRRSL